MTSFSDEFVTLRCPQCGGEVEIAKPTLEQHYIDMGDGSYTYMGSLPSGAEGAKCTHCKTNFVRKQHMSPASVVVNIQYAQGVAIGDNAMAVTTRSVVVNNTTAPIVTGDNNVVAGHQPVRQRGTGGSKFNVSIGRQHGPMVVEDDATVIIDDEGNVTIIR